MPSYWWECLRCGSRRTFVDEYRCTGIVNFLWDILVPANWDQALLIRPCTVCQTESLRMTYEFPRKDKETIRVMHVVGVVGPENYLPMMWETSPSPDLSERWFDFKYLQGRNIRGLMKPAIFTRDDLAALFRLYRDRANQPGFMRD